MAMNDEYNDYAQAMAEHHDYEADPGQFERDEAWEDEDRG